MPTVIGDVKRISLRIFQGADLAFDVEWFEPDGTTPIAMADVDSDIRASVGGTLLLRLSDYITVDSTDTNIAHVLVPASITAGLSIGGGVWDLNATAVISGEVKKLMRGRVRIMPGITVEGS